jgi:heme A synthase
MSDPAKAAQPASPSPVSLRWAARCALAGAALTVVLITFGGLVTNTDSGLACPDWPTCFGTPFPKLVGGIAMEHGHRYLATLVGFVTVLCVAFTARGFARALPLFLAMPLVLAAGSWAGIARHRTGSVPALAGLLVLAGFALFAWGIARSRGASRLAQVALVLVIAQGLLGGLTVMYQLPVTVLVLHTATSMLFLSSLVVLAVQLHAGQAPGAGFGRTLEGGAGFLFLTAAAVYLQILLGAMVRHTGAGLVCTDLPLCRGALWPLAAGTHPAVHLHMVHRTFAFVAFALVLVAGLRAARAAKAAGDLWTGRAALLLPALLAVQITLGILTIWSLKELWTVTGHLFVAALLLAGLVALWTRARLTAAAPGPALAAEPSGRSLAPSGRAA